MVSIIQKNVRLQPQAKLCETYAMQDLLEPPPALPPDHLTGAQGRWGEGIPFLIHTLSSIVAVIVPILPSPLIRADLVSITFKEMFWGTNPEIEIFNTFLLSPDDAGMHSYSVLIEFQEPQSFF